MFYTKSTIYNEFKQVYYKEFRVLITFDTTPNARNHLTCCHSERIRQLAEKRRISSLNFFLTGQQCF
jgi:hypothetical protein